MTYCVVVPNHKEYNKLSENEKICLKSIYKNYPKEIVYMVCPEGLNTEGFEFLTENIIEMSKDYFSTYTGYQVLCTDYEFYKKFEHFDYMLLHQLDAYTIHNETEYFMNLSYDYYGAPWGKMGPKPNACGNGGFSLRKISTMIDFCKKFGTTTIEEDKWFCVIHSDALKICPVEIGWEFSFEAMFPSTIAKMPMGCHKLYAYNKQLWDKVINLNYEDTIHN